MGEAFFKIINKNVYIACSKVIGGLFLFKNKKAQWSHSHCLQFHLEQR